MTLTVRMWIFPGFVDPFPYVITEPNGNRYLPPRLPPDDVDALEVKRAAQLLDLAFMCQYIGEPIDVYIQGIKQKDTILTKVGRQDGLWFFETD